MSRPRLLITGAGGFCGEHACRHFAAAGWDVIAVVRRQPPEGEAEWLEHAAEIAVCDLTSRRETEELVRRARPGYVLHLAGMNAVGPSWADPAAVMETNVTGTIHLLEAVRKLESELAEEPYGERERVRVLVAGSMLRFPLPPAGIAPKPPHPYSLSKTLQVLAAQSWAALYGMDIVVAEPGNLIGPGRSAGLCALIAAYAAETEAAETMASGEAAAGADGEAGAAVGGAAGPGDAAYSGAVAGAVGEAGASRTAGGGAAAGAVGEARASGAAVSDEAAGGEGAAGTASGGATVEAEGKAACGCPGAAFAAEGGPAAETVRRPAVPPPFRLSSRTERRDLLDVRDAIRAYELLLLKGRSGAVYPVASGQMRTLGEIADTFDSLVRRPLRWEIGQSDLPSPQPADISEMTRLDWRPLIPLAQSVRDALESARRRRSEESTREGVK